jgi:preprotein translocase subunit SecA
MAFLDNVLKVFVGDKSKKDIGELQPLVDEIKKHEAALEKLSLDELRSKTERFREIIKEDQKVHLQSD